MSLHGPAGDLAVAVNDMRILECLTPELLAAHAERVRHAAALVVDCNLTADALACAALTLSAEQANHPGLSVASVLQLLRSAAQ
jgi:hypothetical protein